MPELPEVETTKSGIQPHIENQIVTKVIVRNNKLRWPVAKNLAQILEKQRLLKVKRRAKYLLLEFAQGTLILHLGMSGSLRIVDAKEPPMIHDHIDIIFKTGACLRLRDPRRFGACLWTDSDILQHPLLAHLGPEPLTDEFNVDSLHKSCKNRTRSIKQHIMDNRIVVGVGNIYASEALFKAAIHPKRAAGKISKKRLLTLVKIIKEVLQQAITQGGTTLKDFTNADGEPGYFAQELCVYGLSGQPCGRCKTPIKQITQGQRSSYYCPQCQR